MNLDNLDDAEKFQKHFVSPMVDAVRAELAPLVDRVAALESVKDSVNARVTTLEGYAKRIGTVYSGLVAVVTFFAHWAWSKVQGHFHT